MKWITKRMKRSNQRFLKSLQPIIATLLLCPFYAVYLTIMESIALHRMRSDANIMRCRNCDAVWEYARLKLQTNIGANIFGSYEPSIQGTIASGESYKQFCGRCGTMHHYARSTREFVVPMARKSRHPTHYDNGEQSDPPSRRSAQILNHSFSRRHG